MLQYKTELLQQIVSGLRTLAPRSAIGVIQVVFECDGVAYNFDLVHALEVIANDLYWDERGNWSAAQTARVELI